MRGVIWALLLASCAGPSTSSDADGDGFGAAGGDCDDNDPGVYPGAEQIWYDGVDQACDGNDDDQDLDGTPSPADCEDTNAAVHPGALDTIGDAFDGDCDGSEMTAFEEQTSFGEDVCGPSLDEDEEGRMGLMFGSAGSKGTDAGVLVSRLWDGETGEIDRGVEASLSWKDRDNNDHSESVFAIDHTEYPSFSQQLVATVAKLDGIGFFAIRYATGLTGGWTRGSGRFVSGREDPMTTSIRFLGDTGVVVGCSSTGLSVMRGTHAAFESSDEEHAAAGVPDVARCSATEGSEVLVLQQSGRLLTYDWVEGGLSLMEGSESGWTALDSHDGHVLLGGPGQLQLRADGVTTDVAIEGTPTAVRLGGDPKGDWVAAWTTAEGGVTLTVVGGTTRTFIADVGPDPLDDFDVAWAPGGLLMIAIRSGDSVHYSRSILKGD